MSRSLFVLSDTRDLRYCVFICSLAPSNPLFCEDLVTIMFDRSLGIPFGRSLLQTRPILYKLSNVVSEISESLSTSY